MCKKGNKLAQLIPEQVAENTGEQTNKQTKKRASNHLYHNQLVNLSLCTLPFFWGEGTICPTQHGVLHISESPKTFLKHRNR